MFVKRNNLFRQFKILIQVIKIWVNDVKVFIIKNYEKLKKESKKVNIIHGNTPADGKNPKIKINQTKLIMR